MTQLVFTGPTERPTPPALRPYAGATLMPGQTIDVPDDRAADLPKLPKIQLAGS